MRNEGNARKLCSWLSVITIVILFGWSCTSNHEESRVLVFTKTTGFKHESIPSGIEAIKKLGIKHHFLVDTTENASSFHEENLQRYQAIIFLNTTGDVLN